MAICYTSHSLFFTNSFTMTLFSVARCYFYACHDVGPLMSQTNKLGLEKHRKKINNSTVTCVTIAKCLRLNNVLFKL